MLPTPNRKVPLHEILEFKESNKGALTDFRGYQDQLYRSVIVAENKVDALTVVLQQLECERGASNKG